jgi:y4mF family transcriptional regulator
MQIHIDSVEKLGQVVRAARKDQKLRQDDAAGSVGVSENFLAKLERGGETVQLGKVLRVLEELGIRVSVDVTESVAARLNPRSSKSS